MKRVLVLNAGHTEIPIIKELRKLGCYIITTGNRDDLPGHRLADKYLKADYSDKEAILRVGQEEAIDKIVSCAYDAAYMSAAYVDEKMDLGGHDTYRNACLLHEKDQFKQLCQTLHIPNPISTPFNNMEEAFSYTKNVQYPVMVKATDQASGIGVMKANNYIEAQEAVKNAFDKSKNKRIVIEPFIEGEQESFVAFVVDGKVVQYTSCDCYSPINPYLIQTETMPSRHFQLLKEQLISIVELLFSELNLVDGLITLQYIVRDEKPFVIEMMRRCLGNRFLYPVSYVTGLNWYQAMTMAELGMDCHNLKAVKPLAKYAGHHAIMSTCNGIYKGTIIPEDIMVHVQEYDELFQEGELIENYMSERMGYIYYTYQNRDEMDINAKHFNERIQVLIERN